MELSEIRDVAVIAYAIAGTLAFVAILLVTLILGFLGMNVMGRVKSLLKDNVQPAAENAKATAQNIRGTVEYVSDTAVKPVVTAYGMAAGARRFVGVVSRFTGKKGA
jgi:hypothetical protein